MSSSTLQHMLLSPSPHPTVSPTPQGENTQLMNFPSWCYFCVTLLHWFLGSWYDMEKGHGSWPVGLASYNSFVLRLMEPMSGGSSLCTSPVKLCCGGYTLLRFKLQGE